MENEQVSESNGFHDGDGLAQHYHLVRPRWVRDRERRILQLGPAVLSVPIQRAWSDGIQLLSAYFFLGVTVICALLFIGTTAVGRIRTNKKEVM